jgi:hypothetical protein
MTSEGRLITTRKQNEQFVTCEVNINSEEERNERVWSYK